MEVIEIKQADVLQAINKSEIDIQVATAKQYPRNIPDVIIPVFISGIYLCHRGFFGKE